MGWLDTIRNIAGNAVDVFGTSGLPVRLPELGLSERIAGGPTINTTPSILGVSSAPSGQNYSSANASYGPTSTPTTGGGSGGSGITTGGTPSTPNTGGGAPSGVDTAGQAYQARLAEIAARVAMIKDIAARNVSQATDTANTVKQNIEDTYGNLKTDVGNRVSSAVSNLGQEDVNTQNLYGRAGGTARAALASALLRNRMAARASGGGNNSFYQSLQSNTTNTGQKTIGQSAEEEAAKRAGIATRTTDVQNEGLSTATKLDTEAAGLKSQADQQLQQEVNAAQDIERGAGIDMSANIDQAYADYQSRLDAINQNVQTIKTNILGALATNKQSVGDFIKNYQDYSPQLSNIISNVTGLNATNNLGDTLPNPYGIASSGTPSGTDLLALKGNPTSYQDILKALGLDLSGSSTTA